MFLVNLSQDKSILNPYLSNTLLKEIKLSITSNKKVILYLNKRGEFSSLICTNCSYLYKCSYCDISMSVHKYPSKLLCHICNFEKNIPTKCIKCNKQALDKVGIGTQQIEDSLKKEFLNFNVFRFDTDSVKNKTSKKNALNELEKADIIIGTKMITTGFDFRKIGVIGVILLEQELLIPKYNTEENVYSNIKQLIGRGSRRGEISNIVIQTFIPENEIIKSITEFNYKDFFIKTLEERKLFNYPPFVEMFIVEYRHINQTKAENFIKQMKSKLDLNNKINEFEITLVPNFIKKHNQYFYKIIIKGNNLRDFIKIIKPDIFKNSNLAIIFE